MARPRKDPGFQPITTEQFKKLGFSWFQADKEDVWYSREGAEIVYNRLTNAVFILRTDNEGPPQLLYDGRVDNYIALRKRLRKLFGILFI